MIMLVAALYKCGIAIVFFNQQYIVYKPPYDKGQFCVIEPEKYTQAISKQGFSAEEKDFATFEELFKYMKEKLNKGEWEKISRE